VSSSYHKATTDWLTLQNGPKHQEKLKAAVRQGVHDWEPVRTVSEKTGMLQVSLNGIQEVDGSTPFSSTKNQVLFEQERVRLCYNSND
jgi:hypothetical protein